MTRIRDYETLVFLHITSKGIGGKIIYFSLNVVDRKTFLDYGSGQLDESEADLPESLYEKTFDLEHGNHLPDIKDIVPDINSYCIITYNGFEYDIPQILDEEINVK